MIGVECVLVSRRYRGDDCRRDQARMLRGEQDCEPAAGLTPLFRNTTRLNSDRGRRRGRVYSSCGDYVKLNALPARCARAEATDRAAHPIRVKPAGRGTFVLRFAGFNRSIQTCLARGSSAPETRCQAQSAVAQIAALTFAARVAWKLRCANARFCLCSRRADTCNQDRVSSPSLRTAGCSTCRN